MVLICVLPQVALWGKEKCIKYMVFGNVLRNHTYPISVSSEPVSYTHLDVYKRQIQTGVS